MKTWATIGRALRDEQNCAMVSIVDAKGSAPREPGARMVVLEDGSFAGTIGGGTLEWQAIERARAALAKGTAGWVAPPVDLERMALGPDLGQCCGGSVRILLEVFTPGRAAEVQALAEAEKAGLFVTEGRISERCVERTILERDLPGSEDSLLAADGRLLGAVRNAEAGPGADWRRSCRPRHDHRARAARLQRGVDRSAQGRISLHRAGRRARRGSGRTWRPSWTRCPTARSCW